MGDSAPMIHVLDRDNYSKHRLVTLPNKSPSPLAPSSLRFRSKLIGLTTGNLSYARIGHLMGWYDVYPLPSNISAPYDDSHKYGRISAWGYAEIIESTIDGIAPGQTVFGYLPISTDIEDVRVVFAEHDGAKIENQIVVLDEHRQHLWKVYNRYQVCAPLADLERSKGLESLGWDALMQVLFGTSYNLSTYAFAWDEGNRIHPSGEGDWTAADADLRGATVVILNASGKTGMSFAYNLRHSRPQEQQPATIIGVGSPASVSTIEKSGFYGKVVLNSDSEITASVIAESDTRRIVFLDFGARAGANASWQSALSSTSIPFTLVTVGAEVEIQNSEKIQARFANRETLNIVNASLLREKGIAAGGAKYFNDYYEAFEGFKKKVVGVQLQWGEGLESWERGWEALCRDEVRANSGLVYRI